MPSSECLSASVRGWFMHLFALPLAVHARTSGAKEYEFGTRTYWSLVVVDGRGSCCVGKLPSIVFVMFQRLLAVFEWTLALAVTASSTVREVLMHFRRPVESITCRFVRCCLNTAWTAPNIAEFRQHIQSDELEWLCDKIEKFKGTCGARETSRCFVRAWLAQHW